jgi:hypothetical protein
MSDAGPFTAYPGIEETLRRQLREAALDHEAFALRLKACELPKCRATCCHDGAFLTDEEMAGIGEAVEGHRGLLAGYGWNDARYLTRDGRQGRTVTRAAGDELLAEDFPRHFPRTRCVFLDPEHRCVLQRLAMDEGRHPWWWKPVSCWMHPLLLRPPAGSRRPSLTLARPGKDPAAAAGYPGFGSCTPCGIEAGGGLPAWQTLRPELELLGKISGRDLLRELGGEGASRALGPSDSGARDTPSP